MSFFQSLLSAGGVDPFVEPTPPSSDIIVDLDFSMFQSLWQESTVLSSNVPITAVSANTNPVGTILDLSGNAMHFTAGGSTTRPTYSTTNIGLVFDGSNDIHTLVSGNASMFREIHAVSPLAGLRFKILKNLDGSARVLMGNNQLTTGSNAAGFTIQFTAANKIRLHTAKGTTGTAAIDYTTSRTINIASGLTTVHINLNGTGSNACSIRMREANGTVTTETFTMLAGQAVDPTLAFYIGGNGTFFNGTLCHGLRIVNRVWTTQEMTDFEALSPSTSSSDIPVVKRHYYDFTDIAFVFEDTGGANPVENGDEVRLVTNKYTGNTYTFKPTRTLTGAAGTGLIWNSGLKNGLGGLSADGSGTRLLTFTQDVWQGASTVSTTFIVLKNSDNILGSQWIPGNGSYGTFTGAGYSGNAGNTGDAAQPYHIFHAIGGSTNGPTVFISRSNDVNIIAIRSLGLLLEEWNQAGTLYSVATAGGLSWLNLGLDSIDTAWRPEGQAFEIQQYRGLISNDQISAKIAELRTKYAIPANVN